MFKKCKQKTLGQNSRKWRYIYDKMIWRFICTCILVDIIASAQFKLIRSTKIIEFSHFQLFEIFGGYFFWTCENRMLVIKIIHVWLITLLKISKKETTSKTTKRYCTCKVISTNHTLLLDITLDQTAFREKNCYYGCI